MADYNELLTGFSLLANRPIEKNLLLTADEMLNFPTDYSFNGRFCIGYVNSEYSLYVYDSSKTASTETGNFHKASSDAVVFTEVTTLPTTDINEQTIYLHKTTNLLNKYKFIASEEANYTVASTGITEVATSTEEDWDTVTANWSTKYASITEVDATSGTITEYDDSGATKYIDTASFTESTTYIPKYYHDSQWRRMGGGGGLSNVSINDATLEETNTSDSLNITWQGSQDAYDALTSKNEQTLYCVDDDETLPSGSSYNDLNDKPTLEGITLQGAKTLGSFGIASVASVNLKQNATDNSLNTTSKNIALAINECLQRINALAGGIQIKVVATQPTTGMVNNTIYFIGATSPYTMKLYQDVGGWTDLGSTAISLEGYAKCEYLTTDGCIEMEI